MKNLFFLLFAVLLADSTSMSKIWLRENIGSGMVIDSVTTVTTFEGNIIVGRNKKRYGVYPFHHYSIIKMEKGKF